MNPFGTLIQIWVSQNFFVNLFLSFYIELKPSVYNIQGFFQGDVAVLIDNISNDIFCTALCTPGG